MIAPRVFLVAVALLASACSGAASTAAADTPDGRVLRVLFVGNSLTATNDLPAMVAKLARVAGRPRIEYRTLAPGGVSLEDHWNAGAAPAELASGDWDAVVLQQGPSALLESQVNLKEWATRFADAARQQGTRPALLTAWPESYRARALSDVIRSYANAATAARAKLLPAGAAWRAAWKRNPALPLYGPDGFHPSRLGTYLTAVVVLAGLTGTEPVSRPYRDRGLTITRARARLLHDAAVEALTAKR